MAQIESAAEGRAQVQVINDELDYNPGTVEFLKAQGLFANKQAYNTVAVIGCQSSGKSTLLNLLFGTTFDVMDDDYGRQQTTKGVWMSCNDRKNILVFDIEGTDSKERGEQRITFEQTTSLLALAISDVVLINMWATDIGRYQASNYGLLKVIFECNLKLFGQASSKKLLFVIRDFKDKGNNYERTRAQIEEDIGKLWDEIHKPDAHKDTKATDLFEFDFEMMPHKVYEEERFVERAGQLRERFSLGDAKSLFSGKANNVPVDGLGIFFEQTWATIRSQKELNLPDQREMVANYRCNEIKQEALDKVAPALQALKRNSSSNLVTGFKESCENIVKESVDYYDGEAYQYQKEVFSKIRQQIEDLIFKDLLFCFDSQLKILEARYLETFKASMKSAFKKDVANDEFHAVTALYKEKAKEGFANESRKLRLLDRGWEDHEEQYASALERQMQEAVDAARDVEIQKLSALTVQATKETMEELINGPIYNLKDDFWTEINEPVKQELALVIQNCRGILQTGFHARPDEVTEFVDDFLTQMRRFTTDYVRKLFKDINTNLTRRHKAEFQTDERGTQRSWVALEEAQIQELSVKARDSVLVVVNRFKYIEIDYEAIGLLAAGTDEPEGETPGGFQIPEPSSGSARRGRSPTLMYDKLLSEVEINKVKDRFKQDVETSLEEALRKHHNLGSGGTPMFIYVLLAYFAYDDILRMMWNPFIFTPLVFVLSAVGLMYTMGMGPIMVPLLKGEANKLLRRGGVPFKI